MKLSAWLSIADLLSIKKTLTERLITVVYGKRKLYQTHDLAFVFSSLKKSGVDGVELLIPLLSTKEDIKKVQQILTINNMPVNSIHQSLTSLASITKEEITTLCIIAKQFSAKVIVLHAGALDHRLFDKDYIAFLQKLQKNYAVTFGIENMPKSPLSFGKSYTYNQEAFSALMKQVNLSITFDTTHLGQSGGDILSFYTMHRKKIVDIHLSDYKKDWRNTYLLLQNKTHLPLLQGELPIKELFTLLKKDRYSGCITMEIATDLAGTCHCAKLIKKYLK